VSIEITDDTMTSDQTWHKATLTWPAGDGWRVSWLPDRALDRNQAITAMTLAERVSAGVGGAGDPDWTFIEGWAAELGLSGADAVGKISYTEVELRDRGTQQ
jgi:hypothetical protein